MPRPFFLGGLHSWKPASPLKGCIYSVKGRAAGVGADQRLPSLGQEEELTMKGSEEIWEVMELYILIVVMNTPLPAFVKTGQTTQ